MKTRFINIIEISLENSVELTVLVVREQCRLDLRDTFQLYIPCWFFVCVNFCVYTYIYMCVYALFRVMLYCLAFVKYKKILKTALSN